ncbi:Dolichyl-phosphate-mannose-protein mannosyltransferase [uncultured archaeon]|nr:Dolichyl-phosphate-mannose-protein mannosyltransferase [uncultured archaeon]
MEKEKESEKRLEKRKESIIKWFKDPYNLTLVGIIVFSIVIEIYYFILTKNQPLWYDEAEYMSGALNWLKGVPFHFSPQRPVFFHFLIFLLMSIGFNETAIKFALSLLPAILLVPVTYFLVKDMYNKKIALISSFIMAFFWMNIFYSMRVMTDMIGLLFGLLSFYCFWQGYVKKKSKYYLWLMGFFISLSTMIRLIGVLYGLTLVLYLLFTDRLKFLKNKDLWIAVLIAVLTTCPLLVWYYNYHGNVLSLISSNVGGSHLGSTANPIAWNLLNYIPAYLYTTLLIMFFIGLFTLVDLVMGFDMFFKRKRKDLDSDFFTILSLLFVLAFFIFYFRGAEDRWMIAMALPLFVFAAKGIVFVSDIIGKNINKYLGVAFILIVLILGAYAHLTFANTLVDVKKDSYLQVKEAALWIKANSQPGDIIFSNSITQNTYYSERETIPFGENETEFWASVKAKNPRYLVASVFEAYPDWATANPSEKFKTTVQPVNAFFLDAEQKQVALVIYELKSPATTPLLPPVSSGNKTNSSSK